MVWARPSTSNFPRPQPIHLQDGVGVGVYSSQAPPGVQMNWDLGSGRSSHVLSSSDCCFVTYGEGDTEQLGATLTVNVFPLRS